MRHFQEGKPNPGGSPLPAGSHWGLGSSVAHTPPPIPPDPGWMGWQVGGWVGCLAGWLAMFIAKYHSHANHKTVTVTVIVNQITPERKEAGTVTVTVSV